MPRLIAVFVFFATLGLPLASAQTWPDRTIRIIAPSAPGGGFDLTARIFAEKLGAALPATIVVENKIGAGTRTGTELAAAAEPDGNTLLIGSLTNLAQVPGFYKDLKIDTVRDFAVLGIPVMFPYTLVARPDFPFATLQETLAAAKAAPEKYTYGGGKGTGPATAMAIISSVSGARFLEVPYRGAQAIYQDLLAGRIDLYFDNSSTARPFVDTNKVRALVVSSKQRLPYHPHLPTVRESGIDFDQESWFGLFAPAATPRPIIERLRMEMKKIAEAPDMRAFWEKTGGVPLNLSLADMEKMVAEDAVRWKKMIRDAGETLD